MSLHIDPRPVSVGRDFEVFGGTLEGRRVAVKVARAGAEAREPQLIGEADALQRLQKTGVVPICYGLERLPNGRLALVRGWVEGESLATLIERSLVRHRWQGARRWNAPTRALVLAILDALERVHDAGLVHNDLKPDDILLRIRDDGGFDATLIDLGLAARPQRSGPGGTVAYAAPERLEGEPGTVRSDLWALGAIVFELMAGTRAYAADQPVDARLERRHPIDGSPREGAAQAWRRLPVELQVGLASALAADPRQRPRSVAALKKLLRLEPVGRERVAVRAAPMGQIMGKTMGKTRNAPALIAVALATLAGLALAWGPGSRALGLDRSSPPAACEAMRQRAERLCSGLSGEDSCRAALTATEDCATRAALLGACEAP